MGITDELRKWWVRKFPVMDKELHEDFTAIADRIDAEHDEMHDFCERLERAVTNREDVTLWGVDYTALPLDADGVPVHIGDRVENGERVSRIVLTDGSWEPSVYVEMLPNVLHEHFCHEISHYHAPTVEDVLMDLLGEWSDEGNDATPTELAEKYAKRLTLADGKDA